MFPLVLKLDVLHLSNRLYPAAFSFSCLVHSVHDDVQLCQWLRTKDGTLKLGDFNRAEVMEYNQKNETYCEYFNGSCYGNVSMLCFWVSANFVA
jgi:hypothetical protein